MTNFLRLVLAVYATVPRCHISESEIRHFIKLYVFLSHKNSFNGMHFLKMFSNVKNKVNTFIQTILYSKVNCFYSLNHYSALYIFFFSRRNNKICSCSCILFIVPYDHRIHGTLFPNSILSFISTMGSSDDTVRGSISFFSCSFHCFVLFHFLLGWSQSLIASEQDYEDKGLDYLEHNVDDGEEIQLTNFLSRKGHLQDCGTQLDVLTTHLHRNSPSAMCIHPEQSGQDISTYESSQWHQCSYGYKLTWQHCENLSSIRHTSKNPNDNTWDQQER